MKIRISVTKEILKKSQYCTRLNANENCAIALAVRDILPDAKVFTYAILPADGVELIRLPIVASHFIMDFDGNMPEGRIKMKPISFEIDLPEEVINCINISEITELLTNHPTLAIV